MKILNEENGRIVRCENCDTKIQYEKEDIKYREFGFPYLKCPVCNKNINLDNEEDLKLNFNNIEYPIHFHQFDSKKDAVEIDNKQINIFDRNEGKLITNLPVDDRLLETLEML